MKKIIIFMVFVLTARFVSAQSADGLIVSVTYNHFSPANDSTEKIYKGGSGFEVMTGLCYNKFVIAGSAGFDAFKLANTLDGGKESDLWLNGLIGAKYYFGKKELSKKFIGPFIAANYGWSLSKFTDRVYGKPSPSAIWNIGAGIQVAGFTAGYFYHNMKNKATKDWMSTHGLKIGFTFYSNKNKLSD